MWIRELKKNREEQEMGKQLDHFLYLCMQEDPQLGDVAKDETNPFIQTWVTAFAHPQWRETNWEKENDLSCIISVAQSPTSAV